MSGRGGANAGNLNFWNQRKKNLLNDLRPHKKSAIMCKKKKKKKRK